MVRTGDSVYALLIHVHVFACTCIYSVHICTFMNPCTSLDQGQAVVHETSEEQGNNIQITEHSVVAT